MFESFDFFRSHKLINAILPYLASQYENYLDFGCGNGIFAYELYKTLQSKNKNIIMTCYDIHDFRYSIVKSANFRFTSEFNSIKNKSLDVCLIIDVLHHLLFSQSKLNTIENTLMKLLLKLKSQSLILVKDYLLDSNFSLYSLQKLSLTMKDIIANPRDMTKGFTYLTGTDWSDLWNNLNFKVISSLPYYYLPLEEYYSKITGQAWLWILRKK